MREREREREVDALDCNFSIVASAQAIRRKMKYATARNTVGCYRMQYRRVIRHNKVDAADPGEREMCSGSEAGSCLRLMDYVYHSTLRVIEKKKKFTTTCHAVGCYRMQYHFVYGMPLYRSTRYTLHPTPFTLHPSPYTPHLSPIILHPTPYTLHPSP